MSEGNTGESWKDKLNSKFSEIYSQYSIRPKIASSREKINSFIADAEDSTEKATVTVKNKPKEWLFTTSEFVNTNPFFKYTAIAARNYEAQFLVFYTVFGAAFSYKFTPRYLVAGTVSSLVYGKAFAYVSQYKWHHPEMHPEQRKKE
eukprot:gene17100-19494_t